MSRAEHPESFRGPRDSHHRGLLLLALFCLSIRLVPFAAHAETPVPSSAPQIRTAGNAVELLWPGGSEILPIRDGTAALSMMSVRFVQHDGMLYIFAEAINRSSEAVGSPLLTISLSSGGESFIDQWLAPGKAMAQPGEPVFYQGTIHFGKVTIGDWDAQVFSFWDHPEIAVDPAPYRAISIEGDRVVNRGETVVGEIVLLEVVRDAAGIYSGSCRNVSTGANLPSGESIVVPELAPDHASVGCGYTGIGEQASEILSIGGPFTTEWHISEIKPPLETCVCLWRLSVV